jgi:DNA modification methylase
VIHHGDCIEVMATFEPESIDAIVTDPPYGLEFMGKEWDKLDRHGPASFENLGPRATERRPERGDQGSDSSTRYADKPRWSTMGPIATRRMQDWHEAWAREAFRVAKPGAHLLAFGGTRTYHRLASAIEDAGWEVRDTLCWGYSQGFPKSLDVSKAIDKRRDDSAAKWAVADFLRPHVERVGFDVVSAAFGFGDETMARARWTSHSQTNTPTWDQWLRLKVLCGFGDDMDAEVWRLNGRKGTPGEAWDQREVVGIGTAGLGKNRPAHEGGYKPDYDITAPATDLAREWQGWGTALKPAWEPIVLARKPLRGTVAGNVTEYGTGALNIDGCRIRTDDNLNGGAYAATGTERADGWGMQRAGAGEYAQPAGRWPANVILTDPIFDGDTPGVVGGGRADGAVSNGRRSGNGAMFDPGEAEQRPSFADSGTYSRFFLVPKSSRSDREPIVEPRCNHWPGQERCYWCDLGRPERNNVHPTVKPTDLMRHLVRLVTPPGGVVLDPFLGSGTTAIAAELEGFAWVGIEREAEYVAIAEARLNGTQRGLGLAV